jgi:putative SOS response-associated peptidase YedK
MCGRYGVAVTDATLVALGEALLGAAVTPEEGLDWGPWPEVRPTDVAPVLRAAADGRLVLAGHPWGLRLTVPRADGRGTRETRVINARAETARQKKAFRDGQRALVPATGWTEWPAQAVATAGLSARAPAEAFPTGEPVAIAAPDGRVLWFAALVGAPRVERLAGEASRAEGERPFVILTRPPVEAIASVHDRMPAVVDAAAARRWLCGAEAPEDLLAAPVVPALVARPAGPPRPRQLALF